jgi:2-oxoglutarate ferredoxin oxidoreductase subunit gamma
MPDLFLALTQEAADTYLKESDTNGIIIADERVKINDEIQYEKLYNAPILKTASKKVGKSIVANIVALGMIVEATKIVSKESILEAVLNRVPKGTEELNKLALESGYALVK